MAQLNDSMLVLSSPRDLRETQLASCVMHVWNSAQVLYILTIVLIQITYSYVKYRQCRFLMEPNHAFHYTTAHINTTH